MKYLKFFSFLPFLLLLISSSSHSQSISGIEKSFSENTPAEMQFKMHLDTIRRYNSINFDIMKESMDACFDLLDDGLEIEDSQKLEFALLQTYYHLNLGNLVEGVGIMADAKGFLDDEGVSSKIRNTFLYIEGYTLMSLGDHEAAQKRYYDLLERGRMNKDTLSMLQSTYSLGQLYESKEELEEAEKYFEEVYELKKNSQFESRSQMPLLLSLTRVKMELKKYDEAEKKLEEAFLLDKTQNVSAYRVDLYIRKAEIALVKGELLIAESTYQNALHLAEEMDSPLHINLCTYLEAKILNAKGQHKEALVIYERLIEYERGYAEESLKVHRFAHETCKRMGDYKKSYQFLLQANAIRDSIQNDEKKQQTAYLNVKFEAKEKEKENERLAAQVLHEKMQNKFLFVLAGLFLLLMIILFGAFYQKKKYNRRLSSEVQARTKDLKYSNTKLISTNKELDELNRILSHDLKEPLRSIVSFSSLLEREVDENKKAIEYLTFIKKSGKQLSQLIQDVSLFQQKGSASLEPTVDINVSELISGISKELKPLLDAKNASITAVVIPTIHGHYSVLHGCFKHLVENGVKYNQSPNPSVQIRYQQDGSDHVFQFQDNGIGIAPHFHERIFGMFKRLNDRRHYEGSGLGLSICKKVLGKINGEITVLKSDKEEGSTFQFRFPMIVEKEAKVDEAILVSEAAS